MLTMLTFMLLLSLLLKIWLLLFWLSGRKVQNKHPTNQSPCYLFGPEMSFWTVPWLLLLLLLLLLELTLLMILPAIVAATTPLVMKVHRLKPGQDNHHYIPPCDWLAAFRSPRNFLPPPGDDVDGAGQAVTLVCFFLYPAGMYLTCLLEGRRICFSFKGLLTFINRIRVKTNSNFLMMNVSQSVTINVLSF